MIQRAANVRPSLRQLAWQNLEFIGFIHYTVNAFTDKEWGEGTESPSIFNPTQLDTRQWAKVAKDAGMKMIILTAKHHDGFCLWPSKYTEHSVKNSPYKNGQGDIVGELAKACREAGLKLGLYLSPWDRHEPTYGDTEAYNRYYKNQLRELLTNYGEITEVWFDGAKGPNAKNMEYDWNGYYAIVHELQPKAVIFNGPDIRWVGNERGYARESEWSVMNRNDAPFGFINRHAEGPGQPRSSRERQSSRLVSGGDGCLHPPGLVLSRQGGRQGQVRRATARHLLQLRRLQQRAAAEPAARPARADP